MALRFRDLKNTSSGTTPLSPLRAGRPAKRDRVLSAHADADRTLGNGRRVIGRVGLHGEAAHQIVSSTTTTGPQVYPTKTASRVALRTKLLLTPGHFVMVSALVVPSGATQKFNMGTGQWILDAVVGYIDITIAYDGGFSETVTHTLNLPTSELQYGGEGTDSGWAWAAMRRVESPLLAPVGALNNSLTLQKWSEEVTATVTVAYRGGPRVVDLVVREVPFGYARSVGVDATATYSSPLATVAGGQPPATYPSVYPLEETGASNPTFGATLLADVVDRQQHRLGPVLAQWSGWRESQAVTATAAVGVTTTSLTYVNLLDTSITAWAAASPGWSLASGGQAQQADTSDARRITRDKAACVPVRCWVYGSRTGSGTSTVRFQTEAYSVAEVSITSTTDSWWSMTGHLRCGLGPEDTSVLQILGKLAAAGTLTVRHVLVEYLDV